MNDLTRQNIKNEINNLLDKNVKDKQMIFTVVSEKLDIAKPIVRRVAREMRLEMLRKLEVLYGNVTQQLSEIKNDI